MRPFFLFLVPFAFSSPCFAKTVSLELSPTLKIDVELHEDAGAEDSIDFLRDGHVIQTESSLGDHFVPLLHGGKEEAVQAIDLDHDGTKEILVRLLMVPMGVVRVFHWNAHEKKFKRLTFGKKNEDGVPVPTTLPVKLLDNGNLEFAGGPDAKKPKRYVIEWKGHDYSLPAKPASR